MNTALLIVDVQNDFTPGGALAVPAGDEVVPRLSQYIGLFHRAGMLVVATRDWHPELTKHFRSGGGLWPPHCVQGTPGAEFHPALRLPPDVLIMSKGMDPDEDAYSAFQARTENGTPFAELLKQRSVGRILIGGLATDYCVLATVLDAVAAGLKVTLLADGIRGINLKPGDIERAVAQMVAAGADLSTLNRCPQPPTVER